MKIAFTPAVYEHAARFVGRTPWEVSRDADLMFEGHRRAYLEYRHQVIAVGIDITDWAGAVGLGLAPWIAFPVVLLTGSVIHENVPWKLAAIHAGDWWVKLVVVSVIVSLWR